MIVCSCYAITDRDLRATLRAAREGKPFQLLAGTGCGCCLETLIDIMIEEARATAKEPDEGAPCASGGQPP